MKCAGIDFNKDDVVIAFLINGSLPIFKDFYLKNDNVYSYIADYLKKKGVEIVFIENPITNDNRIVKYSNILQIKENAKIMEKMYKLIKKLKEEGIFVYYVNPFNTSKLCPICNNLLEQYHSIHYLKCSKCNLLMDKDKIASWNILKRGIEEWNMKGMMKKARN